jgi:16S rRNA (cytidine1402-2'-O)-methyltransferase
LELLFEKAPEAHVIVGRELTKMFEEVVRGNVQEVLEYFRNHPEKIKGEFTIVVKK